MDDRETYHAVVNTFEFLIHVTLPQHEALNHRTVLKQIRITRLEQDKSLFFISGKM